MAAGGDDNSANNKSPLLPTYKDLLLDASRRLNNYHEAKIIVGEVLFGSSVSRKDDCLQSADPTGGENINNLSARLFLRQDLPVDPKDSHDIEAMLQRRLSGEPLQHILGHYSFRSLEIKTDKRALIPRVETEMLVEVALRELDHLLSAGLATKNSLTDNLDILDIGTGSGAIACSLVTECKYINVTCIDISMDALSLAEENRMLLPEKDRERVALLGADLTQPVKNAAVNLICSNPPYLAKSELAGLDREVRDYDPAGALIAGPTGFEIIERIIYSAPAILKENGVLVMEMAPLQTNKAVALAENLGAKRVSVINDLAGRERILLSCW